MNQPKQLMEQEQEGRRYVAPFAIADADHILKNVYNKNASENRFALLDALSTNGMTLFITERVLRECLPTKKGKIKVRKIKHDDGYHFHRVVTDTHSLRKADTKVFAHYLDQRQQAGEVRYYTSINGALKADEIEDPKGGIVIIKNQSDKMPVSEIEESFYKDAGDNSIIRLLDDILRQEIYKSPNAICFPVLTGDKQLQGRVSALNERYDNKNGVFCANKRQCEKGFRTAENNMTGADISMPQEIRSEGGWRFAQWYQTCELHHNRYDLSPAYNRWQSRIDEEKSSVPLTSL